MSAKKTKVLVVDDEPEIVEILSHFLSVQGYEVRGALNGDEVLKMLEQERADMLLLDIMMPGLKGTEVVRIVKEKYPAIKVIIVTGNAREAQELSKNNFLEGMFIKPINIHELYNKLLEIINKKEKLDLDVNRKKEQQIDASIMEIKARLLFIEPSLEIYNFLKVYFKELAGKGENYELDVVDNQKDILEKIVIFNPDIFVVNAAAFRNDSEITTSKIFNGDSGIKEVVVYNIRDIINLQNQDLVKLTNTIEGICLKNGFIEIKWIKI